MSQKIDSDELLQQIDYINNFNHGNKKFYLGILFGTILSLVASILVIAWQNKYNSFLLNNVDDIFIFSCIIFCFIVFLIIQEINNNQKEINDNLEVKKNIIAMKLSLDYYGKPVEKEVEQQFENINKDLENKKEIKLRTY